MTTETIIPPCPEPNTYAVLVWRADRRTKTGWRQIDSCELEFPTPNHAEEWQAQHQEANTRIEVRPKWVLKHGFMPPHKPFWEMWNVPHACSAASETYWST